MTTTPQPAPPEPKKERNYFIGGYVPRDIKQALKDESAKESRTVSQQLLHILTERYTKGQHD